MTIRLRRGLIAGLGVAFVVPVSSIAIADLVVNKVIAFETARPLLDVFGMLTWATLAVFGPVGIVIAARSAGIRGPTAWAAVAVLAFPAYLALWFAGAVSLSGALGNPF
jgi:hypothetical protein